MMLQTVVICATGYPILIRHPGAELGPGAGSRVSRPRPTVSGVAGCMAVRSGGAIKVVSLRARKHGHGVAALNAALGVMG
jgi:hypothetical protein